MIVEDLLIRPRGHLLRNLLLFARLLRTLGVSASPDQVTDLVHALPLLDLRRREEFKDAARAMLVTSREQAEVFDRAFDVFWQAWSTEEQQVAPGGKIKKAPPLDDQAQEGSSEPEPQSDEEAEPETPEEEEPQERMTYSARESLQRKDFAELTEAELHSVRALMRDIRWQPELRRTRRKQAAHHGEHLHFRRIMRRGLRYGGEAMELAWQQPRLKRRPLVVLCDISGSMERYSRILLEFVYAITNGLERVEAFAFGTRLTRITRQLQLSDVDAALHEAAGMVNDWGGGTRIGESLKTFNYEWARRVLGHGAAVLIISDGWDRGELDLLRREMRRLQLSCRRLIWLNPLLGAPDYKPLVQGIQAALPYVDDFLPVHNLHSIERLAAVLEEAAGPRRLRRRARD